MTTRRGGQVGAPRGSSDSFLRAFTQRSSLQNSEWVSAFPVKSTDLSGVSERVLIIRFPLKAVP